MRAVEWLEFDHRCSGATCKPHEALLGALHVALHSPIPFGGSTLCKALCGRDSAAVTQSGTAAALIQTTVNKSDLKFETMENVMKRDLLRILVKRSIALAVCAGCLPGSLLAAQRLATPKQDTGAYSTSQHNRPEAQSMTAEQFAKEAALGNLKEIRFAQLALQNSKSDQVKQFARRLIQDHSKANLQLTQIAQRQGFTLPQTNALHTAAATSRAGRQTVRAPKEQPGTATAPRARERTSPGATTAGRNQARESIAGSAVQVKPETVQTMQKLEGLTGEAFDKAYIKYAVEEHQKDIQKFQKASQNLDNTELKKFASTTLPTLREHYQLAQQTARQLGVSTQATENSSTSESSQSNSDNSIK